MFYFWLQVSCIIIIIRDATILNIMGCSIQHPRFNTCLWIAAFKRTQINYTLSQVSVYCLHVSFKMFLFSFYLVTVAMFTCTLFVSIRLNSFRFMNLNVMFTRTLNKVIGLMCAFMSLKLQIGIDFLFLTCAHCANRVSHCLHIITTLLTCTVSLVVLNSRINIYPFLKQTD